MDATLDQIKEVVAGYIPNLLGALAILIVGWVVAWIIAALIRSALHRTSFPFGAYASSTAAESLRAP